MRWMGWWSQVICLLRAPSMLIIRDLFSPFLLHLLSSSLAYSDLFWKSVEKSFANFVIDRNGVWELQQKLQVFLTSTVDWNEISVWMLNLERLKSFSSYYQRFTNHQNSIVFHLILSFVFVFAFHTNTNTTTCYNWNGRKQAIAGFTTLTSVCLASPASSFIELSVSWSHEIMISKYLKKCFVFFRSGYILDFKIL